MKRRFLPLSLFLIFTMLGGFLMSSSGIIQSKKYVPRTYPKDALSKGNKPSAEYLKLLRNNQITGLINQDNLSQVQNQLSEVRKNRSLGITWKELGPDNFGGRTRAIVFDNKDESAKTVYAASVTGGVWKSTDIGTTWSKINQETSNLNASCMIQTQNGDLYVGTGESFSADAHSALGEMGYTGGFMGNGIYKSTDGENFTLLESTSPQLNNATGDWAFVNELAYDNSTNTLYAANNTGLKYSTDNGNNWKTAIRNHDTLLTNINYSYDIECDSFSIKEDGTLKVYEPDTINTIIDSSKTTKHFELPFVGNSNDVQVNNTGAVIASVNNLGYIINPENNIFTNISTYPYNYDFVLDDSTFTYTKLIPTSGQQDTNYVAIRRQLEYLLDSNEAKLPSDNVKRIEFAIAPSDENIVYASVVNQFEEIHNVYRSANKGETWDIVMPGSEFLVILGGQGVYNNAITVFPDNPNKLLIGGINLWVGNLVQETGFFSWEQISQGFFESQTRNYLHVDQHIYTFRPGYSSQFLIGTDGGVYTSTLSQGFYSYANGNRNYNTTQFYSVGISGLEKYVIGGAQDNGSILITGTGNTVQQGNEIMGNGAFQNGGDGGPAVISLIDKNVLVASTTNGDVKRSDDAGVNYSTNEQFLDGIGNGNSFKTPMALWESFNNPNSRDSIQFFNRTGDTITAGTNTLAHSSNSSQPFYFDMPYDLYIGDSINVVDPVSSRFFLATANHIYMVTDLHNFAKTPDWWQIANNDFTVYGGVPQCIAFSSDANHLFVGNQNGKLYRISNLALAYDSIRADVSSPSCVVSVVQLPIYMDGTTTEISQVVTSIAVDPQNSNNVMVTLGNYGNDQYVLYSSNALDQVPVFTSKQGNLPNMPVYSSIIEMKDSNKAIIGTEHGIFSTTNISSDSPVWEMDNNLMGSVPVFELKQQLIGKERMTVQIGTDEVVFDGVHNKGLIYAATYGRGLFYCNNFWQPIGINEIIDANKKNLSLLVYPNPTIENINIEIEANTNSNASISVYDISGKLVLSQINMVSEGSNVINLEVSTLNKGIYMLITLVDGKTYSNKLMVN